MTFLLGPLLSRFAPYLIAFGIGLAVVAGAYRTGVNAERKRGEAAVLRARIATLQADIAIAEAAAADGAARLATIESQTAADRRILEDLRHAPRPNSCALSPADAQRLQSIGSGGSRRQP